MDITTVNRDELVKNFEEKKSIFADIHKNATDHINSVFEDVLVKYNLEVLGELQIYDGDLNYFHFTVKNDKDYHNIDFHFDRHNYFDKDDTKYTLRMNFCTFGSFDHTNELAVNYLIALGKFAEHLKEIEDYLNEFDWKTYNDTYLAMRKVKWEIESYDACVEANKKNEMIADLEKKLTVGLKVKIGTRYDWVSKTDVDDIREVVKVMPKNINMSGMYNRLKKEDFFNKILDGKWSFVA